MNLTIKPGRDMKAMRDRRRRESLRCLGSIALDVLAACGWLIVLACIVLTYILLA